MLRIWSLSPVNWAILSIYVVNLIRLSLNFRTMYARFALGTTALTNLLLLGLSDSMAQSLRSAANFREMHANLPPDKSTKAELFRYVLDHGRARRVWLDEEGDDLAELGLANASHEMPNLVQEDETENRWTDFDFRRLFLFSCWGFIVSFFQSPWYGFLRIAYSRDAQFVVVVQRVLADQLFYSPIMLSFFLFYLAVVVERRRWAIIKEAPFWSSYVRTLGINMCVWPLAQFVNFLLIPSPAQIPFSSSLSVLWNTYLSLNTQ